ncbi:hypothetical protein MASR2M48_07490 [Spirochaetota bacterium]
MYIIGGTIGYNFAYSLSGDWTRAKGTFTLNARHSLLYLPISLLLGIRDRFFVNIFTKNKFKGEAHAVAASYLGKAHIDGVDAMQRRDVRIGEHTFALLWRGPISQGTGDASVKQEQSYGIFAPTLRQRHSSFTIGQRTEPYVMISRPFSNAYPLLGERNPMSKELSMDIREKFDTILETVKEPQSELSLAELALVSKIQIALIKHRQ